jgi:dienelactone hydrolase
MWGRHDVETAEVDLDRGGESVPATLLTPRRPDGALPAWIILHGITRPGRAHRQLVRFTHALSSGGCAVLVPEVPEWRELDLAPGLTLPTVRAALRFLASYGISSQDDGVGLLGFSFGAPQAIAASSDPSVRDHLAGVAGFGGYCDLERTIAFQFTGRHEWQGEDHHLRPDPYGRWIVGANYLTTVPGLEDLGEVAQGLRALASAAGDRGIPSWSPELEGDKQDMRATLPERMHDVFDLFVPRPGMDPDPVAGREMAHALAAAGRTVDPLIEPALQFLGVQGPVHLLHGRQDHLIPFSEALRLEQALPANTVASATITRLFGHSAQDPLPGPVESVREGVRFLGALGRILGVPTGRRGVSASEGGAEPRP